jgi:hypothetical protein
MAEISSNYTSKYGRTASTYAQPLNNNTKIKAFLRTDFVFSSNFEYQGYVFPNLPKNRVRKVGLGMVVQR